MSIKLDLPLTPNAVQSLNVGDVVYLSGELYTARDAAHRRIAETVAAGGAPPVDLQNQTIFYTGPAPTKPGAVIGPLGPTTSVRMDSFVELMFRQGMLAMIGKGDRNSYVADLCKQYKGVYFLGIGGAAALVTSNVLDVEVVAYEDLGTESIKRLVVKDLKVVVGIDTQGRVLHNLEIQKYRR